MHSKKTDTYQYLSPNSCHPKNRAKNTPIGVAERIRRNCKDTNSSYLMKSGHSEKDIDKSFCQRATIPRRETLKKKSNRKHNSKIKTITEYEPSLINIYSVWRKDNHLL